MLVMFRVKLCSIHDAENHRDFSRRNDTWCKQCRGRWGELDTEVVNCTLLENACRYKNCFGMK